VQWLVQQLIPWKGKLNHLQTDNTINCDTVFIFVSSPELKSH